ncbi:MAG: excinuclease ABC subunit UvrA [Firmicutes bacterium]|nr:excinuclease ABC subunit UvrA [Bacillota bacterium]
MDRKHIIIKEARENNLKSINLSLPKEQLIVFTGLSGSGKTTLAFDTIYMEGQRRYVESLSSYARQFLGNVEKPDVESIEGLSPAISIDQKSTSHNPRSTVGTVTEIYDYLRLLFARVGVPYCPTHQEPILSFTTTQIVNVMSQLPLQTKLQILSPLVQNEKGTHKDTLTKIKTSGFERVRVDGTFYRLDEVPVLDKNKKHSIDIVIDRLILNPESRTRLFDAVTLALDWSKGYVIGHDGQQDHLFSSHHACKYCGFSVPKLEPRLFSFNAPSGSCPDCHGLGIKREADIIRMVPDQSLSIQQGAITFFRNMIGTPNLYWQEFKKLCELYQIPLDVPYQKLTKEQQKVILFGSPKMHQYQLRSASGNIINRFDFIEGIKAKLERLYNETQSEMMREFYEKYFTDRECTTCKGARLNPQVLSVKVGKKNIDETTRLSMHEFIDWMQQTEKTMTETERTIARLVIKEILSRAGFLMNVGLDYLTLSRMAMTLSGGEAQRIRLATQIGSQLTGVLYVLDEPSIGLHQRDNRRLINTLKTMRDLGNTVIVVEHDEETMREADFIVDIGPGAGALGGEVVAQGKVEDIIRSPRSITGQYLSGQKMIPVPKTHAKGNGKSLTILGAKANNLKNIDVTIPLGKMVVITGVSGSGKSTLINDILYQQILKELNDADVTPGEHRRIEGLQHLDKVINISQEPIGRTPRSNPATYTKVFDEIRDLFAETLEAKARGFDKGRFSFNVPGGRCETCQGDGVKRIPMNFLPDVYVKCEACEGKRYNEETLMVTFKDKNIHDVLELTVDDAQSFFANRVEIARRLKTLHEVGLGYMKLGQSATTLSGGEAQRVKLAFELQKRPTGKTLYILDEPTTGLHIDDVARLVRVLQAIVANGDSVLVIEHNLDVIKVADHIIDLGPEGGDRGGEIVAEGTPEAVAKVKASYTGQFLKSYLR